MLENAENRCFAVKQFLFCGDKSIKTNLISALKMNEKWSRWKQNLAMRTHLKIKCDMIVKTRDLITFCT